MISLTSRQLISPPIILHLLIEFSRLTSCKPVFSKSTQFISAVPPGAPDLDAHLPASLAWTFPFHPRNAQGYWISCQTRTPSYFFWFSILNVLSGLLNVHYLWTISDLGSNLRRWEGMPNMPRVSLKGERAAHTNLLPLGVSLGMHSCGSCSGPGGPWVLLGDVSQVAVGVGRDWEGR